MILRELEEDMDLQALNRKFFFSFSLVFLAIGCESSKLPADGKSAGEVYSDAENLLRDGEFENAGKKFKDIETYFPYSKKAIVARIMSAYCNFKSGSYIDAIRELEIFLRYHPYHELVPYAMYLQAMSEYMIISAVGRDSEQAEKSRSAFIKLLNRFPKSRYAEDCKKRIVLLDDIIAAHELLIGRYYQKRKSSLSAINRYNYVISRFSNTKSAEEALFRMVECCRNEGLSEEADNAISILKARFPNGRWIKKLNGL